jgi:hypothetical protein
MPDGDHVIDLGRCQRGLRPIGKDNLDAVDLGILSQTEGRDRGATGHVAAAGLDRRYLPVSPVVTVILAPGAAWSGSTATCNQVFLLLESLRRI